MKLSNTNATTGVFLGQNTLEYPRYIGNKGLGGTEGVITKGSRPRAQVLTQPHTGMDPGPRKQGEK